MVAKQSKHATRGTTKIPATAPRWSVPPNPDWHEVAIRTYVAAIDSPQAAYYTDSDWSQLYLYASELSSLLFDARPSAERMKALHQLGGDLLLTEGARRRARIEIQPTEESR